jgi:hypothetical protein
MQSGPIGGIMEGKVILISALGDVAFENLAFVIHRSPEVNHLAVQLHVHLIEMPSPMPEPAHPRHALPADIAGEHRAEPAPPMPHRLMTDVNAALGQQILDVRQTQRKPHVHHHYQADHLGR